MALSLHPDTVAGKLYLLLNEKPDEPHAPADLAAAADLSLRYVLTACQDLRSAGYAVLLRSGEWMARPKYPDLPVLQARLGRPLVASVGVVLPIAQASLRDSEPVATRR